MSINTKSTTNGPVITTNLATMEQMVKPELRRLVGMICGHTVSTRDRTEWGRHLHGLNPHDEPAHIADELEGDGEGGDGGLVRGDQGDAGQDWPRGQHHAAAVHPAPAQPLCSSGNI